MTEYKFKYHFEKKPDEIIIWKNSNNIIEPFKDYSRRIKENKDELLFFYKGFSFKYKDCEKNSKFKDEVFSDINPNTIINIIVFPLRKTFKKKELEEQQKNLESSNKNAILSTSLVSLSSSPLTKEEEQKGNSSQGNYSSSEEKKIEQKEKKDEGKTTYNDILCPYCLSTAILENVDKTLKFNIINCKNFHRIKNITYDQFESVDSFPIAKCASCSIYKNQATPPRDRFYACECGNYYCENCLTTHGEQHKKVEIENKNYKCILHDRIFNSYCLDCNVNLCDLCSQSHNKDHTEILNFQHLKPNRDYINKITKAVENQKEILNTFIKNSRKLFEDIINDIENYVNKYIIIERTLLNRYNNGTGNLNFQLLQNIRNYKLFHENYIFDNLNIFNIDENSKNLNYLNQIFMKIREGKKDIKINEDKIIKNDLNNEMTIKYKLKNKGYNKNIKLFDPLFIDYNKNNLTLIIDGKQEKELKEYHYAGQKEEITVKIIEKNPVTNMSFMFNNCQELETIDFSKWKTINITNMESLFQLCPLKEIVGISDWDTTNVISMKGMFSKCVNLEKIPDMTAWKTPNLKDISLLFNGCLSLKSKINFPKWKTPNLEDMSYLFSRCSKVTEIHNLGKLNTSNVKNMCGIFNKCEELIKLPDISSWKTQNVTDISIIFQFCSNLKSCPDISNWNSAKFKDISGVFSECGSLESLPNIGKWNTSEVECMCGLFNECNALKKLPDISKWKTSKVKDLSGMFCGCSKIETIPNLSGWDTSNVSDMSYLFDGCSELKDISSIQKWKMNKVEDKKDALNGCSKIDSKVINEWMNKK